MICEAQGIEIWRKSLSKSIKNGIQDGMHLGIDFSLILMDLGSQVDPQNPPKIGLAGLAWHGEASWRGVARRSVA